MIRFLLIFVLMTLVQFIGSNDLFAGSISVAHSSQQQSPFTILAGRTDTVRWSISNPGPAAFQLSNSLSLETPAVKANPARETNTGPGGMITDVSISNLPTLRGMTINPGTGNTEVLESISTNRMSPPQSVAYSKSYNVTVTVNYGMVNSGVFDQSATSNPITVVVQDPIRVVNFTGGTAYAAGAIPSVPAQGSGSGMTYGWEFALTTGRFVQGLGLWDQGTVGIGTHDIALWNAAGGNPLFQTTLNNSNADYVLPGDQGAFRFEVLSDPLFLAAGTYVVGAFYENGSPDLLRANTNIVAADGVLFQGARVTSGSSLNGIDFPGGAFPLQNGYFGPNLLISDVPEPGSLLLCLVGLGGCLIHHQCRKEPIQTDQA